MYYKYPPNCFSKNTPTATTRLLRGFTLVRDYIYVHGRVRLILGLPGFRNGFSISPERVFVPTSGRKFFVLPAHNGYTYEYYLCYVNVYTCSASEINGGHGPHTLWCAMGCRVGRSTILW